jgi:3-methyladenine DNA glycosylase AlkD
VIVGNSELISQVERILQTYDPAAPQAAAEQLRELWLQFDPKSIVVIKAYLREKQETIGIPVPVLKSIGKQIGKLARQNVDDFIPLVQVLWSDYGREGRVVALIPLGNMELVNPERIVPLLKDLCATCLTWEDADRLAMDALEPVVRQHPEDWLPTLSPWLEDENKWVRRAAVIVVGRLPMRSPQYAGQYLKMIECVLYDQDTDIKKAVSFAVRLVAKGDVASVGDFLEQHIPPTDPTATWVLCDIIRSMAKKLLPEFQDVLLLYKDWLDDPSLSGKDKRSLESAIKTLRIAIEN